MADTANPFPQAAPDFSDPLGLLLACHERIRQHAALLEQLAERLSQQGPDPALQEAAGRVLRYFNSAGHHHHQDEDEDLFPRLLQVAPNLGGMMQALQRQHQHLDSLWASLAPLLADVQAADSRQLQALAQQLNMAYQAHLMAEEKLLFPQARQLLDAASLSELGQRMAARRGVSLAQG